MLHYLYGANTVSFIVLRSLIYSCFVLILAGYSRMENGVQEHE